VKLAENTHDKVKELFNRDDKQQAEAKELLARKVSPPMHSQVNEEA
jgi:hypothetical protein